MKTIIADIPSREAFLKGKGALEIGYPWLAYGAIIALEGVVNKRFRVLEFGCGGSTVFWAENCKNVKSFETNPEWFKNVNERVKEFKNVEIKLGRQEQILNMLEREPDKHFDIVLIDSHPQDAERIVFANTSLRKVKPGGFLIIDNYSKFGMQHFNYPQGEIYTFDELRYSGKGTRICKIA
jgi:predicted O-methyltransferase YrrM